MDNFIKNRANFVLFCCFIILLVWLSFLNRISGILAQESKIDIQSINKYFNRDLPEPIFNKLHKLGTKLINQKPTASRPIDRDIDIWAIRSDGKSKPFPLTIDNKWDDELPEWSPDDGLIAYVSNQSGHKKIWLMKNDGTDKKQLTTESYSDSYPMWSPDGHHIAFIRNDNLYIIEINNRKERQITQNIEVQRLCAWSRDGKSILFFGRSKNEPAKLFEIDITNQNMQDINLNADFHAIWNSLNLCPQRDCVVYEDFEIDNYDITLQDLINENPKKLTRGLSHDRNPKWSHKGDLIIFSSNRKTPDIFDIEW
jgi:Tol biopolymer transport system component